MGALALRRRQLGVPKEDNAPFTAKTVYYIAIHG